MTDDYQQGEWVTAGWRFWRWSKQRFRYRCDPVPGIRKWRGGSNCFRYPRTLQELSTGYIADDEDHTSLTAAQVHKITRVRDLPTAWDDIPRGWRKHTSWKLNRNTQYHGVRMDSSRSRSSVGYERFLDMEEVRGSSPRASTTLLVRDDGDRLEDASTDRLFTEVHRRIRRYLDRERVHAVVGQVDGLGLVDLLVLDVQIGRAHV